MGFMVPDAVMDKNLAEVALSDRMFLCSQEPANYTEASATYCLATVILTAGDGNGDWVIANGDYSGRKLSLTVQNVVGSAAGTANHVAFGVDGSSTLKYVSTLQPFVVANGVGYSMPGKTVWEIRDPV